LQVKLRLDDGITINVSEFYMENVSNMIWRYVRFRKTFAFPTGGGSFPDRDVALFRLGSNIIFDHCTFSAGNDECLDLADTFGDVTVQNCFFQDSKTGILMGTWTGTGDFTLVDNLFTNTSHRFPNTKDGGSYDIINNVVYNWKNRLVNISGLDDTVRANVINNYYKPADDGLRGVGWYGAQIGIMNLQKWQRHSGDDILVYTSGNVIEGDPRFDPAQSDNTGMWSYFTASDPQYTDGSLVDPVLFTGTQFPILGQTYSIKTATDAYTEVLADVGANKTLNADGTWSENQDTRDSNLISEIENDTWTRPIPSDFTYPLHGDIPVIPISNSSRPTGYDTDNDGIPDTYEIAQGWNPNVANDDVVDASGYTQLELFLNEVDSENATPPTQSRNLSKKAKLTPIRQ
jgi:hypothetical protein